MGTQGQKIINKVKQTNSPIFNNGLFVDNQFTSDDYIIEVLDIRKLSK